MPRLEFWKNGKFVKAEGESESPLPTPPLDADDAVIDSIATGTGTIPAAQRDQLLRALSRKFKRENRQQ